MIARFDNSQAKIIDFASRVQTGSKNPLAL
jgi:hypothetical protein